MKTCVRELVSKILIENLGKYVAKIVVRKDFGDNLRIVSCVAMYPDDNCCRCGSFRIPRNNCLWTTKWTPRGECVVV